MTDIQLASGTYIGTPFTDPTSKGGINTNPFLNLSVTTPKPFKLGFFLGRFQHLHIGHEMIIEKASSVCDKLIVLIGSSQEKGTTRNPFDVDTRMDVFYNVYKDNPNVIIRTIADLTHENDHSHAWGRYVLDHVAVYAHGQNISFNPDLMIFGNDEERQTWFDPNDIKGVSQLVINRGNIDISATQMRKYIIEDNFWMWRQYANPKIHGMFRKLRELLLATVTKGE